MIEKRAVAAKAEPTVDAGPPGGAAALARLQATRIAELEHDLTRVNLAAEHARARVLEEASQRARADAARHRLERELEAVYATKLWRHSAPLRRWYALVRSLR